MARSLDEPGFASDSVHWHDLYQAEASQEQRDPVDLTNEIIGTYRVLQSLGQGGMGEVFLAERADQHFQQRVAIKLVKRGLLSKQVLSRLRIERQILASLEHPNIARSQHRTLAGRWLDQGRHSLHRHGVRRRQAHR
jgi:eukaryotic-like serine/threonine-protein kinase